MFGSSTAAWTPFEASQQGCGEFQSQRGDGICYVTLLTQGRPGAGSLWVRQAFRGVADGLEFFLRRQALSNEKAVSRSSNRRVVMETPPTASLESPQAEFLLELLVVALDAPTQPRQ